MITALVLVALASGVGALTLAVQGLYDRVGDLEVDSERRDARTSELGRQMQDLRLRNLPPINRPIVRWDHDLDDLEERIDASGCN